MTKDQNNAFCSKGMHTWFNACSTSININRWLSTTAPLVQFKNRIARHMLAIQEHKVQEATVLNIQTSSVLINVELDVTRFSVVYRGTKTEWRIKHSFECHWSFNIKLIIHSQFSEITLWGLSNCSAILYANTNSQNMRMVFGNGPMKRNMWMVFYISVIVSVKLTAAFKKKKV